MHTFKQAGALAAVCLAAFAASGCQGHNEASLAMAQAAVKTDEAAVGAAVRTREAEAKAAAERLDAYIGDKFADAEKALASRAQAEPNAPSF